MPDAFKALADPTRREILTLLREGPKTSGEIAERFSTAWPTVSRHLGILRDAGLILSERNGQQIVYELNTTVFDDVVNYLLQWTAKGGKRRGTQTLSTPPGGAGGGGGGPRKHA